MDSNRRAAWEKAITTLDRGEEVEPEDHYALLCEDMLEMQDKADAQEEAVFFLRYWLHGQNLDALEWMGEVIAKHWFWLREWDRKWGRSRAQTALRRYINEKDYDHWEALNLIAAHLHRAREPFPVALADWAAAVHEGKRERPPKERGNKGQPPYTYEDRNRVFDVADKWLEHFGMASPESRRGALATFAGVEEEVVTKGLHRWRRENWRPAPWLKFPADTIDE